MSNSAKTEKIRVGVLFGGTSSEKEVSLATGRYVLNLIDPSRFTPVAVYMDYHGRLWKLPPKLVLSNTTKDVESRLEASAERIRYEDLRELIDFAFIALLGKVGEDGTIQGLLELLKIPYSGSGIQASAVAMHKRVNKDLLQANGVLVAKDIRLLRSQYTEQESFEALCTRIDEELGFPIIVKPVAEGSSVGVAAVHSADKLDAALKEAFRWDTEVLIEEFIKGQEFMCVVFGNDEPTAMQPSEVEFVGDIFTYESKYMPGKAEYHTPIRTSAEKIKEIQDLAVKVYSLMGIKGYGRVDGFLKDKEAIYISEPHTGTIMVPSSYVFQQASLQDTPTKGTKGKGGVKGKGGARFNPRMFISAIIDLGLEAHEHKKGIL